MTKILNHFIGGNDWNANEERAELQNPATLESIAQVPYADASTVDAAVSCAREAFSHFRKMTFTERVRLLFRYKALIEKHAEMLAHTVTLEHGKTLNESRGSVRRGIDNLDQALGIANLLKGESLEDIGEGTDVATRRQPIGVVAAITPFNFPAMVPMWFWPYALMTGNTFILKPSERVPLSAHLQASIAKEAGFPDGVFNVVYGAKDTVNAILEHPGIAAVSFVGSTPVAKHIYQTGTHAGKRVQALGGAKNYTVVMPDANVEKSVPVILESAFGCAGQRCLATSMLVFVGDAYDRMMPTLLEQAKKLRLGDGMKDNIDVGPVISAQQKEKVLLYIEKGIEEGATLLLDGRECKVQGGLKGHFVGPSIFGNVRSDTSIARDEIFGPLLSVQRVESLEDAIASIHQCPLANATSIFTDSGKAARTFQHDVGVSMIGINVGVPAPMAYFPFGGTKNSFFGDTKAQGLDAVRFYTDSKVVISRWY